MIREQFFLLLKDLPINRITVKSICDQAGINRATFYRYYENPFHLLQQIEEEFIQSLRQELETLDYRNITDFLLKIIHEIREHADEYLLLISPHGDPLFLDRVIEESSMVKERMFRSVIPGISAEHAQWLFDFITQGNISVLRSWMESGMKEEPEEIAEFINTMNNIIMKGIQMESSP